MTCQRIGFDDWLTEGGGLGKKSVLNSEWMALALNDPILS